ncbi:DUF835 domain-containing protein [Thermococcus aggregans]|uniref:DUF835 domain-containing protein n=1 Tax=Thermococcus aggregans TaxID=110163 RepID=A0A9E7SQ51_THEAG|nr:DUF835 domain-containing protein [Thermococcus aggregans]USS41440.1 DUF835 domain-containing protein [Thermococcus aggregans]
METSIFLATAQFWIIFMSLFGFFLLSYTYIRYKRDPVLWWGLALFSLFVSATAELMNLANIQVLSRALFGALILYGAIRLLEKEKILLSKHFRILSLVPIIVTTYVMFGKILGYSQEWFVVVGIPYAISGFAIALSGFFVFSLLIEAYGQKAKFLGVLLLAYGFYQMLYPFTRAISRLLPFTFVVSVFLIALAIYEMGKFALSREFITGNISVGKVRMKPGLFFIPPKKFEDLKESLSDFPVLAFVRSENLPETWKTFFVTSIHEHRSDIAFPTALPLMSAKVVQYLKEAEEKGTGGVVVFDCLEYLKMYNGFEAIAKFLSSLRDYALLYNGTIIVVLDEDAWDRKELITLQRIASSTEESLKFKNSK